MTTMIGRKRVKYSDIIKVAALAGGLLVSSWVQALHFEPGDELKIDLDTTLAYGAMWRLEKQDKGRMTPARPIATWSLNTINDPAYIDAVLKWNSDDGNRNFDKGDLVSNRMAVTSDMDMKYHNLGFFLRGQLYYDSVYFEETAWDAEGWDDWKGDVDGDGVIGDPTAVEDGCLGAFDGCGTYVGPETINNAVADHSIIDPKNFSDDVKDRHGYNARFLDAYIYGLFPIGDSTLDLRIGRQTISWGESLMLQGGISFAQNRIDAVAATSPGVELKEIFLPTGTVYGQIDLSESITMEAYWQYEWQASELFATGSYFEAQDFLGSEVFLTNVNIRKNCGYGFFDPNITAGYTDPKTGYTAYNGAGLSCYMDATGASDLIGFPGGFGMESKVDSNGMIKAPDVEPDHPSDQFGLAFRFLLEGGSEAGLYMIKYHDKYPSMFAANYGAELKYKSAFFGYSDNSGCRGSSCIEGINTARYTIKYEEDLQLVGLTYNTVVNDIQLGFELTYRHNQPIVPACTYDQIQNTRVDPAGDYIDNTTDPFNPVIAADNELDDPDAIHSDCKDPSLPYMAAKSATNMALAAANGNTLKNQTWVAPATVEKLFAWTTQAEVITYNVGMTYLLPSFPLWDTGFLVGEIGGWQVGSGFEDEDLRVTSIGGFTQQGYGFSFIFLPQYKNVLEGIDLTLPVFVNYTVEGSFSYFNYNEHALWASVGAEAIYLSTTSFGIVFNSYHGANNMWRDRDNVAVNIKYTF